MKNETKFTSDHAENKIKWQCIFLLPLSSVIFLFDNNSKNLGQSNDKTNKLTSSNFSQ